jgi:hypothetical protein
LSKLVKKWVVRAGFNSSRPTVEFTLDYEPSTEKLELIQELNKSDWLEVHERWVMEGK